MSWGTNSSWGFGQLLSYADAARWEGLVKPIRGDAEGTKPLGLRRKKWVNIRKDEATQDIICRLGNTNVVRYKPNGDVVVNIRGWSTASTHDFLWALLALPVRTFDNRSWVSCFYQHSTMGDPISGEFVLPNHKDITFRMGAEKPPRSHAVHGWVTADVEVPHTHKVNREKSHLVRKSYASFARYLRNMIKLRTETTEKKHWTGEVVVEHVVTISMQELTDAGIDKNSPHLNFRKDANSMAQNVRGMMLSDDTHQHYLAFIHIIRGCYSWNYIPANGISIYSNTIMDFYNKLLLFIHKYDVMDKVPSENGKAKRDPYGAWFN